MYSDTGYTAPFPAVSVETVTKKHANDYKFGADPGHRISENAEKRKNQKRMGPAEEGH